MNVYINHDKYILIALIINDAFMLLVDTERLSKRKNNYVINKT